MPSKSPKQARYFAMLAHDPRKAKQEGVPMSVAREFNRADARTGLLDRAMRHKRMADGGQVKTEADRKQEEAMLNYLKNRKAKQDAKRNQKEMLEPFENVGPSFPSPKRYNHGGRVRKKKLY